MGERINEVNAVISHKNKRDSLGALYKAISLESLPQMKVENPPVIKQLIRSFNLESATTQVRLEVVSSMDCLTQKLNPLA